MNTSLDDWFALADKIDMIPNDETANGLRDMYVCIEVARLKGGDCSNNQRYLKNTVDFILSKYKDNANNGDIGITMEKFASGHMSVQKDSN